MIVTETILPEQEGDWTLIRTYSDSDMMIRQNGTDELYEEAIDPDFTNRTYTETDIPIGSDNEEGDKAIGMVDTLLGE